MKYQIFATYFDDTSAFCKSVLTDKPLSLAFLGFEWETFSYNGNRVNVSSVKEFDSIKEAYDLIKNDLTKSFETDATPGNIYISELGVLESGVVLVAKIYDDGTYKIFSCSAIGRMYSVSTNSQSSKTNSVINDPDDLWDKVMGKG